MKNKLITSNIANCLVDNPKNFTYQHMTASENFHLVKRVMSVKPSIKNQRPQKFKHMNSNLDKLKETQKSTQEILKRYESQKENKVLLQKMLQIMERPLISKQTSFQPQFISATIKNRSRPGSSCSQKKPLSRAGSAGSVRSTSNTPTTGFGPSTLNQQIRKKSKNEILKQNLIMVNSLLSVKPKVPLATDLKKWSTKQESFKQQMTLVRYGTPKPMQDISIKMRLSSSRNSRRQSVDSGRYRDQSQNKLGYVNLVPKYGSSQNRKYLLSPVYKVESQGEIKKRQLTYGTLTTKSRTQTPVADLQTSQDRIPSRQGSRRIAKLVTNTFEINSNPNQRLDEQQNQEEEPSPKAEIPILAQQKRSSQSYNHLFRKQQRRPQKSQINFANKQGIQNQLAAFRPMTTPAQTAEIKRKKAKRFLKNLETHNPIESPASEVINPYSNQQEFSEQLNFAQSQDQNFSYEKRPPFRQQERVRTKQPINSQTQMESFNNVNMNNSTVFDDNDQNSDNTWQEKHHTGFGIEEMNQNDSASMNIKTNQTALRKIECDDAFPYEILIPQEYPRLL